MCNMKIPPKNGLDKSACNMVLPVPYACDVALRPCTLRMEMDACSTVRDVEHCGNSGEHRSYTEQPTFSRSYLFLYPKLR